MQRINYTSENQKLDYWRKYRPIIEDLNEKQLRQALVLILDGFPMRLAIDLSMANYK